MKNISGTIIGIVAEVLNISAVTLSLKSGIDITENWDSLNNMDIILAVESFYSITFDAGSLNCLNSILALTVGVEEKIYRRSPNFSDLGAMCRKEE